MLYLTDKNPILLNDSIVLDTSAINIPNIMDVLNDFIKENKKIVLTSTVISELDKMQQINDSLGNKAKFLLSAAANNPVNYKPVLIVETENCADDNIIRFCIENRSRVTLITSDKIMALHARMLDVEVSFFKQDFGNNNLKTLYGTKVINDTLYLSQSKNPDIHVAVWAETSIILAPAMYELEVGNEIFILNTANSKSSFNHFKMVNLNSSENCELVYSAEFTNKSSLYSVDKRYENFLKRF